MVSIWSGTSGELDEVPAEDVRRFEREFLDHLKSAHPEILQSIASTNDKLSDDTINLLRSAIDNFKNTFETGAGTLLRGGDAVTPLDPSQVGQETITRHAKG